MEQKRRTEIILPSVNIAIIGCIEAGPTASIRSLGFENAVGAVSVAALLSGRDDAPVFFESKRIDRHYDRYAEEVAYIEGIPSELQSGVMFDTKSSDDPTSISSRMMVRPSRTLHV